MWKEIRESLKSFRVLTMIQVFIRSNSDAKFLPPKSKRIGVGGKESAKKIQFKYFFISHV